MEVYYITKEDKARIKVKRKRVKIEDIMSSPVITVSITEKANQIAAVMSSKKIGSVVVLSRGSTPIGVITERDMVRRIFSKKKNLHEVLAEEIMSTPLKTIDPQSTITEAALMMRNLGVRRLIIVDRSLNELKLVGIVCSDDIVRIMPELITVISEVHTEVYPKAFIQLNKASLPLGHRKTIFEDVVTDVIRLLYDCALTEEEGRPTSTGFLVGDTQGILNLIPQTSRITFTKKDIHNSPGYLKTLFGIVDGISSAFIVNKHGKLTEVGLFWPLPQIKFPPSSLITPRYIPYAYVTEKVCNSLAFFSFGKLRVVKLFEEGCLQFETSFSWKTGKWVFRNFKQILNILHKLSTEKRIHFDVLCKCFSFAVEMSNRRLGGSFIIGDHETVLSHSEKPIFSFEHIKILDFSGENEEYLINLASKEFAIIIDKTGILKASSTRLLAHPPSNMPVDITNSDGGRHRSAAEMSTVADNSVAIVISEDGPITIYSKGKKIKRI